MQEYLGRLAKALHRLTIYPYDEQIVCEDIPELYVIMRQVVSCGNDKVSIFVHFGICGLHFIVTDSDDDDSLEKLTCDELQCVISLICNEGFVILYSHFVSFCKASYRDIIKLLIKLHLHQA